MKKSKFVPNKECAFVELKKVTCYLLNASHETGAAKARYFNKAGFDISDPETLITSLKDHVINREFIKEEIKDDCTKYVVECNIETPNKNNPCIISVWIIENEEKCPRLITAYPK